MDKKDHPKNWRKILWREWRYTDDEKYAEQLLGTLAHRLPFKLLEYLFPYKYRRWYFWWRDRPKMTEVEVALRQARKVHAKVGMTWTQSLRRLKHPYEYPASLDEFVSDLESKRWWERFIARHRLFDYGGEAVQPLLSIISRKPDLQSEGIHILKNIAWETSAQLRAQAPDLVCSNCLTRFHAHNIDFPWQPGITFYGCRVCQQSRYFFECPQGIVAVLDAGWTETHHHQNGLLQVNWSGQRRLFDCDRVEIIQAADEDVERFAMQVGNDTDPVRQPRYAHMQCLIAADCQLSENSLRILQNFFGEVERQEIFQRTTANIEDTELLYGENMADEESDAYLRGAG